MDVVCWISSSQVRTKFMSFQAAEHGTALEDVSCLSSIEPDARPDAPKTITDAGLLEVGKDPTLMALYEPYTTLADTLIQCYSTLAEAATQDPAKSPTCESILVEMNLLHRRLEKQISKREYGASSERECPIDQFLRVEQDTMVETTEVCDTEPPNKTLDNLHNLFLTQEEGDPEGHDHTAETDF